MVKRQTNRFSRSKHRTPTDRRVFGSFLLWVVAFGVLFFFLAAISIRTRVQEIDTQTALRLPKANNVLAVMDFSWSEVTRTTPPQAGYRLFAVDTQLLNVGTTALRLAPYTESYIIDTSGKKFSASNDALLDRPIYGGEYESQRAAVGQLAYAVPADVQGARWCYELSQTTVREVPLCVPLSEQVKR